MSVGGYCVFFAKWASLLQNNINISCNFASQVFEFFFIFFFLIARLGMKHLSMSLKVTSNGNLYCFFL